MKLLLRRVIWLAFFPLCVALVPVILLEFADTGKWEMFRRIGESWPREIEP